MSLRVVTIAACLIGFAYALGSIARAPGDTGTVVVRVIDAAGNGVDVRHVSLREVVPLRDGVGEPARVWENSARMGIARFEALALGRRYVAEIGWRGIRLESGATPWALRGDLAATQLVLDVGRVPIVRFTLCDAGGLRVTDPRAIVEWIRRTADGRELRRDVAWRFEARSRIAITWNAEEPPNPGDYLRVISGSRPAHRYGSLILPNRKITGVIDLGELRLDRRLGLRVRVVDRRGATISGAGYRVVKMAEPDPHWPRPLWICGLANSVNSDAHGSRHFRWPMLEQIREFVVVHDRFEASAPIRVDREIHEIEVVLDDRPSR